MADDDAQETEKERGENDAQPGGGKKKTVLLVVVVLLLIGLSVGGTVAVMTMLNPPTPAETGEALAEEEPEEAPSPAIYYALKPPLIASFDARGRQRFLQAEITLMTREEDVIPAIDTHMPMLRNALLMLIGGQTFEELQTAEGKELLRVQCLQELQRLLEQEIGKPGIEQVLFTNLVMQ